MTTGTNKRGLVCGNAAYKGKRVLGIDLETYCELDIKECGAWEYVHHPSFEILIMAYAMDTKKVHSVDLAQGEEIPQRVVDAIFDDRYLKSAFNANFELLCLSIHLGVDLEPDNWIDTMILAAYAGLPMSLERLSEVINGKQDQKDKEGKALIRYFSIPCKPTKVNGGRTRNLPEHDPERWARYIAYCVQDVMAERAARIWIVSRFGIDWYEHDMWCVDFRINHRGIKVNRPYVQGLLELYDDSKAKVLAEFKELTGLANPNSQQQLLAWFQGIGLLIENLRAETLQTSLERVKNALRNGTGHTENLRKVKLAIEYKQFISKSSISKYKKMISWTTWGGGRAHFAFQFYGAQRTGRFAGRGIQLQNLPRMHMSPEEMQTYVDTVNLRDWDMLNVLTDDIIDIIKQLSRTSFVAEEDKLFFVSDLNSIEARVLGWVAGVQWRIEVFKTTGKIYETSAAQAFNVPVEEITKDNPLRQQGKVMELALGYGGGKGALATMDFNGEVRPDLSDAAVEEYRSKHKKRCKDLSDNIVKDLMIEANYDRLKKLWRKASPEIPEFWQALEKAAVKCIQTRRKQVVVEDKRIWFTYRSNTLFLHLPSGRELCYPQAWTRKELVYPQDGDDWEPFERYVIYFKTVKGIFWQNEKTYGGKLCENAVQAIARDVLMDAMARIERDPEKKFAIVGHVHDEIITEGDKDADLSDLDNFLTKPIPWADSDLVLGAAGFVSPFYMKD